MKKILLAIILALMVTPSMAANQWYQGSATAPLVGTTKINDLDTATQNYAFDPLDRELSNYQRGFNLVYASAATITAKAGEITVSDAAGSVKLMLKNPSDTTVTWAMIDTGTEAVSTTYYVYATATTTADITAGFVISVNPTTPTGITYFKRIGSFYNNADGNIALYSSDKNLYGGIGAWSTKTNDVIYQATTDGFAVATWEATDISGLDYALRGFSDSTSTPTILRAITRTPTLSGGATTHGGSITFPVRRGDYWEVKRVVSGSLSGESLNIYWIPLGN